MALADPMFDSAGLMMAAVTSPAGSRANPAAGEAEEPAIPMKSPNPPEPRPT